MEHDIDRQFRKEYTEYTGENTYNYETGIFSRDQHITRYSQSYAFYLLKSIPISNLYITIPKKMFYISYAKKKYF
jgi:hypothetical protein